MAHMTASPNSGAGNKVPDQRAGHHGEINALPVERHTDITAADGYNLVLSRQGRTLSRTPYAQVLESAWKSALRLAVCAGHPEHVGCALVVEMAGEHEQVVGQAVEVLNRDPADRLARRQLSGQALGAAHDRARLVQKRRGGPAARQNERVKRS